MAERPILFSTEMVEAILSGRKTQTRRIVKPRYKEGESGFEVCRRKLDGAFCCIQYVDDDGASTRRMPQPCYEGDILYVRETWARIPGASSKGGYAYKYRASGEGRYWDGVAGFCWKPSIHMPKEAARIFLLATSVEAQRLCDITVDDALHEGADISQGFADLKRIWDSAVPKEDLGKYGWDASPWVWAIRFERIARP